jgi:hypothetical protein
MTKIVPKSLFLLLMISCSLIGAVPLPAQGYNSPDDSSPNVSNGGHAWITNKAIEYLKVIAPDVYLLADLYREQLISGAWYADHNSGRCGASFLGLKKKDWPCDSINHYEPKFLFTEDKIPFFEEGAKASVSASEYASDLFTVADNCWSSRDPAITLADWYELPGGLPGGSLPDSCRVPQWRASYVINLTGDYPGDGPLVRIPPLALLGWVLHMVQDATQVYHTYSMPVNGHQEFEDSVDAFIRAGNADTLPFKTTETSLEVSTPGRCGWREPPLSPCGTVVSGFVQDVASETRKSAVNGGFVIDTRVAVARGLEPGNLSQVCCVIPGKQLDPFTKSGLNRAIIYSAKLLSFYFRQNGATELYDAVLIATVF